MLVHFALLSLAITLDDNLIAFGKIDLRRAGFRQIDGRGCLVREPTKHSGKGFVVGLHLCDEFGHSALIDPGHRRHRVGFG